MPTRGEDLPKPPHDCALNLARFPQRTRLGVFRTIPRLEMRPGLQDSQATLMASTSKPFTKRKLPGSYPSAYSLWTEACDPMLQIGALGSRCPLSATGETNPLLSQSSTAAPCIAAGSRCFRLKFDCRSRGTSSGNLSILRPFLPREPRIELQRPVVTVLPTASSPAEDHS